ncbi:MAG: SpoIID/LytB domain-containing protein, partial [Candidatus Peregrinibacteria bacterium]
NDRINIPTPGAQRAARATQQTISSPREASRAGLLIRIRLSSLDAGHTSCTDFNLSVVRSRYRGTITCQMISGSPALINELPLEEYMAGIAEEPDTELYEKQRAFASAARSYAAFYTDPAHRKFPGMPYDGDDSPARFQLYRGMATEVANPQWIRAVQSTAGQVIMKDGQIVKTPYFSSDDGRTRSPDEQGWKNFPFVEVFVSKPDPWCRGFPLSGHGVGMSGCGAAGQAKEGKKAEEILKYYYPGTVIGVS